MIREPTPEDGFTCQDIEAAMNMPQWQARPTEDGWWIGQEDESSEAKIHNVRNHARFKTFPIRHWLGPFKTIAEAEFCEVGINMRRKGKTPCPSSRQP